jgi:hypothetical protein
VVIRKLMATSSLFLGIDSSGGIVSAMESIPRRNRFFLLEKERGDEKSIPASKIEVSWAMGDSIPHSVPTWFLEG